MRILADCQEVCILALPLGAKLFALEPAERRPRHVNREVAKWRSGKISRNPAVESVTTRLAQNIA